VCFVFVDLCVQPNALNANRIGVGACVWEGELLLCAYLASLPRHRFMGARCLELGSGPGLAGLLVAKLGGIAHITDKEVSAAWSCPGKLWPGRRERRRRRC
jgi:hypothetical protein